MKIAGLHSIFWDIEKRSGRKQESVSHIWNTVWESWYEWMNVSVPTLNHNYFDFTQMDSPGHKT